MFLVLAASVAACGTRRIENSQQSASATVPHTPTAKAEPIAITPVDLSIWLPNCIPTKHGCLTLDDVYIAGVIQCEVAGITDSGAALEAQAIAARTYLASYYARRKSPTRINVTARFQCWRQPKSVGALEAARVTRGIVMMREGRPINANYVSGTRHLSIDCKPALPGVSGYDYDDWGTMRQEYLRRKKNREPIQFGGSDWTEVVVTRNEGRTGITVAGTPMSRTSLLNRGAMSQRAAICLSKNMGYETLTILQYFYGDDFSLSAPLPATN